ncbi:MAG TPA: DUF1134 domain-containing protein [Caulobacterales bacterium]|nr:DUF1134 domain-containing protein [Caulobacterales bacterium]
MDDAALSRRALALALGAAAASQMLAAPAWAADTDDTYSEPEIVQAAERFFGAGAEGLATVVRHVFEQNGRPTGYIDGQEGAGAVGVGLRYGVGRLHLKNRSEATRVYWQGPSVGFDTGGNAAKVFTLVYGLGNPDRIFRRFPGVDGSAYFIGGVGVNYARADGITLAPMRAGVGFRLGANIGYLHFSRRRRVNPF